jgi:hypothetical protein
MRVLSVADPVRQEQHHDEGRDVSPRLLGPKVSSRGDESARGALVAACELRLPDGRTIRLQPDDHAA